MIFQSFSQLLQNNPSQHYSYESQTSQKTPWTCSNSCVEPLVAIFGTERLGELGTSERRPSRRPGRGGGAWGTQELPLGGLVEGWGGPERRRRREQWAAAVAAPWTGMETCETRWNVESTSFSESRGVDSSRWLVETVAERWSSATTWVSTKL